MTQKKFLFIERDTIISNQQPYAMGVFSALVDLSAANYTLVLLSNQTTEQDKALLDLLASQGITFFAKHHYQAPELGELVDYLRQQIILRHESYVIGCQPTTQALANNLGIAAIVLDNWQNLSRTILDKPRIADVTRTTNETAIRVTLNVDHGGDIRINTGMDFFDHMLEQLFKHSGVSAQLQVNGDLHIDDHHSVEDTAIVLGEAYRQALGDKRGIARYGFLLPMDEALANIAIDLSGRAHCEFTAPFTRDAIGTFSTEMVSHFFRSFADALQASIHLTLTGHNTHHMIEAAFKGLGKCLKQAMIRQGDDLPSTKGVL